MSEAILRTKIAREADRRARDSLRTSLTPEIERAMSKAFLELFDTEIDAHFIQKSLTPPREIITTMETALFNITATQVGAGLVCVDRTMIDVVVRGILGGDISAKAAASEREVTPTDIALCSHFLKKSLSGIFTKMSEAGKDVSFVDHEREKAPLAFILNQPTYAFLKLSIDAGDTHFGKMEFVLPTTCLEVFSTPHDHGERISEQQRWHSMTQMIVEETPLPLDAVICRTKLRLESLLNMTEGEVLDLGDGSIESLTLEAPTDDGPVCLFEGRLGALAANKAFKVHDVTLDTF